MAVWFRMLSVMILAGIPVHVCLEVLVRTYRGGPLGAVVEKMTQRVEAGAPLSGAMGSFPHVFPPVSIALVGAGEQTGRLPRVLDRVASLLERQARLQRRVVGAFLYPALVLVITAVVVTVLVLMVFPRQREMFETLGIERLPWLTRVVMAGFDVLVSPALVSILAVLALVLLATWPVAGRFYEEHLREHADRLILRMPVVGPVLGKLAGSLVLYGLGNLLDAGGTFGKRAEVAGRLSGNRDMEARFCRAQDLVREGVRLDIAMERCGLFNPMVRSMLRVGVEEGSLAQLCHRTAEILQEEAESLLTTMTVLLEPLALFFMGAVVGLIILASSLPTMEAIRAL